MTEVKASVETANAAKYMTQLCKHWSHRFDVTLDETSGRVTLPGGLVVMEADDSALHIAMHPSCDEARERMKTVVAEHLDRFAFREAPLVYDWR